MRAKDRRRQAKEQTASRIAYLFELFSDGYHLPKHGNVSLQKIIFVLAARAARDPERPVSDEEDAKLADCSHWYARYIDALMEVTHAIKEGIRAGKITLRTDLTGLPIKTALIKPWLIEDEREIAIDAHCRVMRDEVPVRYDSEGWPDGEIMPPEGVRVSLEQADVWAASHGITDLGELALLMSAPEVAPAADTPAPTEAAHSGAKEVTPDNDTERTTAESTVRRKVLAGRRPEDAKDAKPTTHLSAKRSTSLSCVIDIASSKALDPGAPSSVWAELVRLAESTSRPAPLVGYAETEGVKYRNTNDEIKFLSFKNLSDRMLRKRAKAR